MRAAPIATATLLAAAASLALSACGATSQPASGPTTTPIVAVAITPPGASVPTGATQQFSAAVSGTADTAVTWRVQEAAGGSVSAGGLYTAPTSTGVYHVEVTSAADPTRTAVATVSVTGTTAIDGLHVVGNQIRNSAGQEVRIHGVNRAGTEYGCVQGWGIFDGPSDAASLAAIRSWKANAVRIPLNEDCWLGINGVAPAYAGANYQRAISDYVSLVVAQGLIPVLDLHWTAPGTTSANAQTPVPDRDHSPLFWTQVATAFAGNSSVIFELFNEPYPDSDQDTAAAWTCWRDGGTCPGVSYTAAGMQELVTAVRATGATNVLLLSGVQYSNSLSHWLDYKPVDPLNNMGATWHVYNFNVCSTSTCWDANTAPTLASYPVVATEIGENDCSGAFVGPLMTWLDARGGSYMGWVWNTWGSCLALVSSYDGTPAGAYGQTYKDHLATLAP